MSSYDIYIFFLCLIVFTLLTALFSVMLIMLVRFYLRLVNAGLEDENLKIEYEKNKTESNKPSTKVLGYIASAFILVVTVAFFLTFAVSLHVEIKNNSKVEDIPTMKVVKSGSMATKHPDNTYLVEEELHDQIKTFDLITLHKLPPEEALAKYDIVAYERDGNLILHRIVNIEEPNERHPDARYFLLQGDAVEFHDSFPVLYKEMKGIYRGERIPFLGSFFMFMQSPAGYLCILLILIALVATPLTEKKIKSAKDQRLALIIDEPESAEPESEEEIPVKE
ncbi:MAG: hypothetical protein IJN80_04190 [Clostridia bacterium]|nr:hypothetical protein [Clostridia bacterium]